MESNNTIIHKRTKTCTNDQQGGKPSVFGFLSLFPNGFVLRVEPQSQNNKAEQEAKLIKNSIPLARETWKRSPPFRLENMGEFQREEKNGERDPLILYMNLQILGLTFELCTHGTDTKYYSKGFENLIKVKPGPMSD